MAAKPKQKASEPEHQSGNAIDTDKLMGDALSILSAQEIPPGPVKTFVEDALTYLVTMKARQIVDAPQRRGRPINVRVRLLTAKAIAVFKSKDVTFRAAADQVLKQYAKPGENKKKLRTAIEREFTKAKNDSTRGIGNK